RCRGGGDHGADRRGQAGDAARVVTPRRCAKSAGLQRKSALLHSGSLAQPGVRTMKILACNSNRPLAEAISAYLHLPLTDASVRRFQDQEVFVEIHENARGEDVFVIQSTSFPANDNLMELLVTLDALKR